ncbi:MAG: thioredoxin family protein [Desulfobacterales bacterium]|nr:thioredoxin family protein [Desulfobacterales bacterium]
MTPHDEQAILNWWAGSKSQPVVLLSRSADGMDARMASFCDRLKALAPGVTIRRPSDELFRAPALIVGRHKNIAFQAVPTERELPPFLAALGQGTDGQAPEPALPDSAAAIQLPAELTLFIAMQCPHCPQAAMQLIALADANPPVRLTIIDGTLFPGLARDQGIRSVPTLILEDRVRWSGPFKMEEIVDQCIRRDPTQLSATCLRQIVESGDAPRLAVMMTKQGQIFPALTELLCHDRWSVRLGAMVTMEYLCSDAPELAAAFIPRLLERFDGLAETVQVDVVQVLAQTRHATAREWLESLVKQDACPAVKEAAAEELGLWP